MDGALPAHRAPPDPDRFPPVTGAALAQRMGISRSVLRRARRFLRDGRYAAWEIRGSAPMISSSLYRLRPASLPALWLALADGWERAAPHERGAFVHLLQRLRAGEEA